MATLDKNLERIELLSSLFIDKDADTTVASQEVQDIDYESGSNAGEDGNLVVKLKKKKHHHRHNHHSPMRLRDRLANFFGYRNSVDEQLMKFANDEELEECQLEKEREPSLPDTIKSDETRGSSLINEQTTYYNTLRNKHIEDIPNPDQSENEIPIG
ncbi:hypothetical protein BN7_2897 [Wickerhamomyces ciferrii]|uniref:Uncharacterized protein n=1 Tax=Wickerhamomyces ciferrii (strain ATCC 14091 / BCRC 22168 / CBS 111 / JCM 3599 / NBRC 0793 / NRRL Y-1031 F-60-10) TaxID=1206466 RepID=K0KPN9_WICCF|nr:uncharacterized protein BN7_2897 [Wickerhamomyces ciferrii]CCH43349.1 hypothetical protein BN7_2897 [Wickerhamomyces ciferrii]